MYNNNRRLPGVNRVTSGTSSLPPTTRILFRGQGLSSEGMERLERECEATEHLIKNTVMAADLQRMQACTPRVRPRRPLRPILPLAPPVVHRHPFQPPLALRPSPSAEPPPNPQLPPYPTQRVTYSEQDVDTLVEVCIQRLPEYSELKRGEMGRFWKQIRAEVYRQSGKDFKTSDRKMASLAKQRASTRRSCNQRQQADEPSEREKLLDQWNGRLATEEARQTNQRAENGIQFRQSNRRLVSKSEVYEEGGVGGGGGGSGEGAEERLQREGVPRRALSGVAQQGTRGSDSGERERATTRSAMGNQGGERKTSLKRERAKLIGQYLDDWREVNRNNQKSVVELAKGLGRMEEKVDSLLLMVAGEKQGRKRRREESEQGEELS